MAQYLDKDALVAEIKKLKAELPKNRGYKRNAYNHVLHIIDSFEVKEVDLGEDVKEALAQVYIDYTFKRHNIDPDSKEGQLIYYAYIHGINACLKELKVQKGK